MEIIRKQLAVEETLDSIFELLDAAQAAMESTREKIVACEGGQEISIREIVLDNYGQEEVVVRMNELPEIRWIVPIVPRVTVVRIL